MSALKLKPPDLNFPIVMDSSDILYFSKQPHRAFPQPITTLPPHPQPSLSYLFLDSVTYTKIIRSSVKTGSLIHGKLAHAHMIKTSFQPCLFLLNNLLYMYSKCGELCNAQNLFDKMSKRNVISYNSLISGYSQWGVHDKVMRAFCQARMGGLKLDKFTYAGALGVCGHTGDIQFGKLIHSLVIVDGLSNQVVLVNSLIDMYSKCCQIEQAKLLFETSKVLDEVSWNSMIAGYVRSRVNEEVFELLVKMHRSGMMLSSYTLGSVLKACCTKGMNRFGETLHGYIVKLGLDIDVVVGTALLDMYAKNENLLSAIQIFKFTPNPNLITYNAMIAGFLQAGTNSTEYAREALHLFSEMKRQGMKPSKFTFSSILKACIGDETFEVGKQIHAQICKNNLQSDEFIGSALVDLYSFSGSIEDGLRCFNSTPKLDVVSWTSMIAGSVQNGQFENALSLFHQLLASGIKPDEFIISSVMGACADMATARSGGQIQSYALKSGIANFTIVQNSQICMYAKSGDIDLAKQTFQETVSADVVSWSVLICSTGQHGFAREALQLFELMITTGIEPNQVTFLGVLTACSHGGLVEEGLQFFETMKKDYGIAASVKHNACIVDLLGRAGRLEDAQNFIFDSGFENDPVLWRALLSACKVHKDTVMAKHVADRVIELEPQAAASYVLLYNVYNEAGKEKPALEVRKLMQNRGVKKEPGISWIEVGSKVYSFVVGDHSHPMSQLIYSRLEEMLEKIKRIVSDNAKLPLSISGVELRGKTGLKGHHSEKLAVTFGILFLPKSAPVRVMKNLRVCSDCHTIMKLISEIEKREIILRDAIRFHHFREGSCSCKDYW
ncbi:pentatricopeptide repeat-containing protein At3g13880 [Neltuma alba]|uniref:pentatricopeptide repeat-containing protein At3g13880 n=1 Tax=Neltuma alba TaxID=207710 RepID=UPI0010A3CD22|nr:pentatricopeptide repeat-containing protein At3g13880 [Prosopis alba]